MFSPYLPSQVDTLNQGCQNIYYWHPTLKRESGVRIFGLASGVAALVGEAVGVGLMRTSERTAGRLRETVLIYFVWLGTGILCSWSPTPWL